MFRELEKHDVAGIKVHSNMIALEAVDEAVHLGGRQQVAVEEDVLNVQVDAEFLGQGHEPSHGVPCPAVADVVGHRIMVLEPRDVDSAGNHKQIFNPQVMDRMKHFCRQLQAARPRSRIVAGEGIGPIQERT